MEQTRDHYSALSAPPLIFLSILDNVRRND